MVTDAVLDSHDAWRLGAFFGIVLLSLIVGRLGRFFLERFAAGAAKTRRKVLAVAIGACARPMVLLGLALGVWVIVTWDPLALPGGLRTLLSTVSQILSAIAAGFAVYSLVDVVDVYLGGIADRTDSRIDDVLAPMVGKSIRITVASLVILNVVTVVSGKSIMTILAGLGVGGLAVALAGQETIKNFFGSLVILGDKPFEIGDRVVIGGHDGPVEGVGFRSTKIRTLDGHLVTVPNAEIVSGTVQNIGKRPYIRRVANLGIRYDTPAPKVARAVAVLKEILHEHEGMHPEFPPRVFLTEFKDYSLNILMIYWYHPPDYWKSLEFSERVNMLILERFGTEGIEFAFPTSTVYLEPQVSGDPSRAS